MIIDRLFDIFTGTAATLLVIAFSYAIGFAVMPARHNKTNESNYSLHVGAWGAAVGIIWFWYGLVLHIPFPSSAKLLAAIVIVLVLIRRKQILIAPNFIKTLDDAPWFALLYALFYLISYIFLAPPTGNHYLPITRAGNNDIFNYFILAKYIQNPGTSNIANFSFFDEPSKTLFFTPAVFTWIAAIAVFFRNDTMAAAMPALFGTAALIGCGVVYLSRITFNLSWRYALCIGAVMISGPFFRYIVGNYFLSSLLAISLTITLLNSSVKLIQIDHHPHWSKFALRFTPFYIAIFYCYPPLLVIAIGLQAGLLITNLLVDFNFFRHENSKNIAKSRIIAQCSIGLTSCLLLTAIVDPWHARDMFRLLSDISSRSGVGWPLNLISPFGIYGLPSAINLQRPPLLWIAISLTMLSLCVIVYFYIRHRKQLTAVSGLSVFLLSCLSLLFYFAYFFHSGATYQQWKIASYLPLPLSFAFFGSIGELVKEKNSKNLVSKRTVLALACIGIIIGNLTLHFRRDPTHDRFSSDYRNLTALNMIGGSNDLYVKMSNFSSTFFALYFIDFKRLHLLSPSYYPQERLDIRTVSSSRPLFLEGIECDANDNSITIRGVGCLHYAPPRLTSGQQYHFSEMIPGLIETKGLGEPESWGIWSTARTTQFDVLLDSSGADRSAVRYINFLVSPLTLGPVKSQHIQASWGARSSGQYTLTQREWISLPYTNNDLHDKHLGEMLVNMTLPDAVEPHNIDIRDPEQRLLGVGFISLSVSDTPLGHVLTP